MGQRYIDYREQWAETLKLEKITEMPTQLDFELNPSCNLKCPMCTWSAVKTFGKGSESWMSFEFYKKIVDEVASGVYSINLNYVNEPLIRKDIPQFVSYAVQKGIPEVMFNTNGVLLKPDMSEALIDAGLTKLSVSLDASTEETYAKIRVGSDFGKVMENIDHFIEIRKKKGRKTPLLKLTFLVLDINKHELDDFISKWRKIVDFISIQSAVNPFDDDKTEERAKTLGAVFKNHPSTVEVSEDMSNTGCHMPFQRMTVRSNGDVLPCCDFRGEDLVVGNADKSTIRTIWQGNQLQTLREIHKKKVWHQNAVCKKCMENRGKVGPDASRFDD